MDKDQAQKIRYLNSNSGWEGIDEEYVVYKNEPSEIDKIYMRCFSSEEGQKSFTAFTVNNNRSTSMDTWYRAVLWLCQGRTELNCKRNYSTYEEMQ